MTLTEIFAPLSIDTFLRDYVGKRHLVVRGSPQKFQRVVTWEELNDALSGMDMTDERVRLVKLGRGVPVTEFTQGSRSGEVRWLDTPRVIRHIVDGATLVINRADLFATVLRQLTASCEDVFQIDVGANVYAGWCADNGFDVHWDTHDTLILQIRGRKKWKVWAPTRLHPLRDDSLDIAPRPEGEPEWQGTLEAGDVLYLPRGWWHVAYPLNEVSLHVTIGLALRTGIDFLAWVAERARECADVRGDVPHWSEPENKTLWIATLRREVGRLLTDDAIDRYLRGLVSNAKPLPVVRLTDKMTIMLTENSPLRLAHGRRLVIDRRTGTTFLSFIVKGTEWRCQAGLEPALALLNHERPSTLRAMREAIGESDKPLLVPFITALVMADVLWLGSHDSKEPTGCAVAGGPALQCLM